MTRILVFGASHVAQLSQAYHALRSRKALPQDLALAFVSAPGPVAGRLKVTGPYLRLLGKPEVWPDGLLPAKTFDEWYDLTRERFAALADGDTIDLRQFDLVFYLGGQLLSHWHRIDAAISSGAYSSACLLQLCTDVILRSDLHRCLRQDDPGEETCRILASFEPIDSELRPEYDDARSGMGRFSTTQDLLRSAAARLGHEILPFPMDLINAAGNAVSGRFHSEKPQDHRHLNPQGASHVLRSMLAAVPALAGQTFPLLEP